MKKNLILILSAIMLIGSFSMPTFAKNIVGNANVPYIKLNNGVQMPQFGLGTFALDDKDGEAYNAVLTALKAGYRHIDTAMPMLMKEVLVEQLKIVAFHVKKFGLHQNYDRMNLEKVQPKKQLIKC